MYEKYIKEFGLTDKHFLWSRISLNDAIEIMRKPEVKILDQNSGGLYISSNSYGGDFVFVTLRAGNEFVHLYGLGYHDYREKYLDYFGINTGNDSLYKDTPFIADKEAFINLLIARNKDEKSYWEEEAEPRSEQAALFSLLADYGDEDGALAEIWDMD